MSAPDRIYLQWIEDEAMQYVPEGVTWCQDKIEDDDVEYVRADSPEITAYKELHAAVVAGIDKWCPTDTLEAALDRIDKLGEKDV